MPRPCSNPQSTPASSRDEGFLLLGVIVMIALLLIALAIAAPIIARDIRRDKDVEAVHRGNQYVRAIQLYYRKFARYPGSMDQLEKSNNIRFLRKRYADPINGQDDFTPIPVGQNKTTVKTFFGQPLTGLPGTGPGGAAPGIAGASAIGTPAGAISFGPTSPTPTTGATGASNPAGATGAAGPGTSGAAGATGTAASPGVGGAATGTSSPTSLFGNSAGSFGSSGSLAAPFMGVTLGAKGNSIVELNEQTDYGTWEFLYDPRLDQLKAKAAALNGGGAGGVPGSSLGQPGIPSGLTGSPTSPAPGGTTIPTSPTTPTAGTPPGTQP
jgi:type II secretory pathway pseudopilin PulG